MVLMCYCLLSQAVLSAQRKLMFLSNFKISGFECQLSQVRHPEGRDEGVLCEVQRSHLCQTGETGHHDSSHQPGQHRPGSRRTQRVSQMFCLNITTAQWVDTSMMLQSCFNGNICNKHTTHLVFCRHQIFPSPDVNRSVGEWQRLFLRREK